MKRSLSALAISGALAISPTHARAEDGAAIAAAALLGALAIYGLSEQKKDKKTSSTTEVKHTKHTTNSHSHSFSSGARKGYQRVPYGHSILPLHCVRGGGHGKNGYQSLVVSDSCLSKANYRGWLPRKCETWFSGKKSDRPGYGVGCLVDRGFLIGGGR